MENMIPNLSFENTQYAFEYKTNKDLKSAYWLFRMMNKQWLVKLGTRLTPWAIKTGLPVNYFIRKTIFKQFVGGENLNQTKTVAEKLNQYHVKIILDYGVEGGHEGEAGFNASLNQFLDVINFASKQPNIPFMSIKVTGLARFNLLEKIDQLMKKQGSFLLNNYNEALKTLPADERIEWNNVFERLNQICKFASEKNIGVQIDAEESWIQEPVDALSALLMIEYNQQKAVVYNTAQLYRTNRLAFIKYMHQLANEKKFILGLKLVRGAYMEKERLRAKENNYLSPIQANKESTDQDYDAAVTYCILNLTNIACIIASHNEKSNLLGATLLAQNNLPLNHTHVQFSQLYGMSDHITYNLAHSGYSVSKYLPFGPIKDVIPYLMRRAQENTSVGGQTGRELLLIKKELKRRKRS